MCRCSDVGADLLKRIGIEQPLDALAGRQLAPRVLRVDSLLSAAALSCRSLFQIGSLILFDLIGRVRATWHADGLWAGSRNINIYCTHEFRSRRED